MRRAQKISRFRYGLVAGQTDDAEKLITAGFTRADKLTPEGLALHEAIKPEITRQNIYRWVCQNL